MVKQCFRKAWTVSSILTSGSINRNMKINNQKNKFHYSRPSLSAAEEDMLLYKKLIKAVVGIVLLLSLTFLTLEFLGPKIFSVLGLLSLDRFKKTIIKKVATQRPTFADLPNATKISKVTIEGYSELKSRVKLFVNGPEAYSTEVDSDGKFKFNDVNLTEGQNIIFAKATTPNKDESEKSDTVFVTYDNKKPEITISEPKDGVLIKNVDSRIKVKGMVNEPSSLTVNTHTTIVDASGSFETLISLKKGDNKIFLMAIDLAGNEASSSISVRYEKP